MNQSEVAPARQQTDTLNQGAVKLAQYLLPREHLLTNAPVVVLESAEFAGLAKDVNQIATEVLEAGKFESVRIESHAFDKYGNPLDNYAAIVVIDKTVSAS